jgi:uncharacterized damage-inducible protein DinB
VLKSRVALWSLAASVVVALFGLTAARGSGTPGIHDSPAGIRDEFLHQFDASMTKVIALAEAIPADRYAKSAADGAMPLAQIHAHIARYNYYYPANAMGIAPGAGIDPDTLERVSDKTQVVALLRRSAEHVRQTVRSMPESQLGQTTTLYGRQVPQWAVLVQLLAHMNDHMGQSIAYARAAGVVPPWSR